MERLYKATSLIERDALITALKSAGLDATAEDRSISRKVTDTTVDVSFEGYTAIIDGFWIFVPEDQKDEAMHVVNAYLEGVRTSDPIQRPYLQRFYMASVFSITLPIILHAAGLYFLFKGLRLGEKLRPLPFIGSLLIFIPSGVMGGLVVVEFLKKFQLI